MANIQSPQELDPEFQAAPFIPPYPKHLQSPQEFMKYNGWKPLNAELGVGYEKRHRYGLTSREEDKAFGEMLSRSERFDQERSAWVQAHAQNYANTIKQAGESIDFRPGAQMPSPAQPSEAVSPFGPQFNMPNPGLAPPNMPFAPEPVGSANAPRIRPPMSAVESVPFSQAQPARPMKIGGYETFDPQEQGILSNLLKGPVTQNQITAVKSVLPGFGAIPKKPDTKASTQEALQQHYLKTGNIEGLEILGDVREKWKADKDAAKELADILTAANVQEGSPQWTKAFEKLAEKKSTHPPAAQQQMIVKQEGAESAKVGAGFGEDFVTMQRAATAANTKLAKLDRMKALMEGVTTGKLIPTITEIESLGKTLGFSVNPTLPAKQAIEALSNEMALELRSTGEGAGMPGAMSDKDREFLVGMSPGLIKTPEGNALIIETKKKLLQREQEVAKLARAYRLKKGHIDEGFYDELQAYADSHPLFSGGGKPWEKYKGK